jgi:tRNA threonylcarbamoyladenosine biosynthesis protein TsaE
MKTRLQPIHQPRFSRAQVHVSHPDLGKSKLARLSIQGLQQRCRIQLPRLIHLLILETRDIAWLSPADCARTAGALATHAALAHAVIELHGQLGVGKTTFVRYLLQSLGVTGTIKSPSYAVMELYELPSFSVSHFDFYRFNDPQEWEDAGFRDVFAEPGLKLVEWPDKAMGLLPVPDLRIHIHLPDACAPAQVADVRQVRMQAATALGVSLLL